MLGDLHPQAQQLFKSTSSLDTVCRELDDPQKHLVDKVHPTICASGVHECQLGCHSCVSQAVGTCWWSSRNEVFRLSAGFSAVFQSICALAEY